METFIVYILCGLHGSGKSTWCKENHPDLPIVSRDIIRSKLGFTHSSDEKVVLTWKEEKQVTEEEYSQVIGYINNHQSFIIDDTNIIPKYRRDIICGLKKGGAKIIGVNINTPLEICIKRRESQIPSEAIERMYRKMIPLKEEDVDILINEKGY